MRVAIAGGHGKIALHLTRMLAERGDQVVSLIRNPDQSGDIEDAGGAPVIADLERASADELAAAIGSADAIVFAAGAGPGSGPERKESVDYEGAAKLADAGRKLEAQRYVIVSSMGADPDHPGDDVFDVYLRAKGRADEAAIGSGLTYVIVRPGMLTDGQGTGLVTVASSVERGEIPREDVAAVLAECLRTESVADRVFEVVGGETPIPDALTRL